MALTGYVFLLDCELGRIGRINCGIEDLIQIPGSAPDFQMGIFPPDAAPPPLFYDDEPVNFLLLLLYLLIAPNEPPPRLLEDTVIFYL